MSDAPVMKCGRCGAAIPPGALEGFCLVCLFRESALHRQQPAALPASFPGRIGDYEIVNEIGRGGMGRVYRARQISLDRIVALKVIPAGEMAAGSSVERFRTEAEAAASLDHPNIVSIYEVGEDGPWNYFSMRLIEGGTLGQALVIGPLPFERAARLAETMARAIQHAHERGVLHRDVKPGNILLDAAGEPHVTDFSLARFTDRESNLTLTQTALGTPAYMAPEQAAGRVKEITTAADIYGIGAVLFEMLTGRPPFEGDTPMAIARKVVEQEPPAPASINPATPPELAIICLKCMEKDPLRRYPSAAALAEDLGCWLRHEPISAHAATPVERASKWIRRNRARAALFATVIVSLVAITVVSSIFGLRAERARKQSDEANRQLSAHLRQLEWQQAEELAGGGRRADALALFARFLRKDSTDSVVATRILAMLSQRSFAIPIGPPLRHEGKVNSVEFSPSGDRALTSGDDGFAKIWDSRTTGLLAVLTNGAPCFAKFAFGGERVVAACSDGWTYSYEARSGERLAQWQGQARGEAMRLMAVSPAANRVWTMVDKRTVRLWNIDTGAPASEPIEHPMTVYSLQLSPDGRVLAIGGGDGGLYLWDSRTAQLLRSPLLMEGRVGTLVFSPDGKTLLAGARAGDLLFLEASTGEILFKRREDPVENLGAAFSPDSRYVVVRAHGKKARLWDARSGQVLSEPFGDSVNITDAGFTRDSRRVVLATREGSAQMWDPATQKTLSEPFEHRGPIERLALSADGITVATASQDGTARLWAVRTFTPVSSTISLPGKPWALQFSPDGTRLALSGGNTARLYDAQTGVAAGAWMKHSNMIYVAAFSRDGRRLCTTSDDRTVHIWDANSGEPAAPILIHPGATTRANFSPDGRILATTCVDGFLRLFDSDSAREIGQVLHPAEAITVEFSPGGDTLLTGCVDGAARLFSVQEVLGRPAGGARPIIQPMIHEGIVWSACFSSDGRRIATASADRTARLWDSRTGEATAKRMGHAKGVWSAEFSPDDRWLLTASDDGTARVWDATTGEPVSQPMRHRTGARVLQAHFSPDGKLALTCSDDHTARLWDAQTGFPMSEPMQHDDWVYRCAFRPDGRHVVTASNDETARFWRVMVAPQPVAPWLADLAEALAGKRASARGDFEPIPVMQLDTLKKKLLQNAGTNFYSRWARWFFVDRFANASHGFSELTIEAGE